MRWIDAYFPFTEPSIELELFILAKKHNMSVEQFTNVGNHLHLLVHARTRESLQNFLRSFARRVALLMVGVKKKFWSHLVFSRIVEWGRDQKAVVLYIIRNFLEVELQIPYQRGKPPPYILLM